VHRLRAWSDAVVVGAGTAIADDPALTARGPAWKDARPPLRVVVDSGGRVPGDLRLFDGAAPTLVATTDRTPETRLAEWTEAGSDVAVLDRDAAGGVSLGALVHELGKRDVQGLLVEGGAELAFGAVREGLVDRVVVYLAPVLVGGTAAAGVLGGEGFTPITDAVRLERVEAEPIGRDLKVVADVHGHR
jgi:diaminohydroxyphosphoribosylaminopyrimidine deaminase/5-amino-6-(5-phosphoribosylamino)uracil reductase